MSRAREIADRDLAATELILDADNDTSITADTDDQIDFKTGGTDRMSIKSTGQIFIGNTSGTLPSGTMGVSSAGRHIIANDGAGFLLLQDNSTAAQNNGFDIHMGGVPAGTATYFSGGSIGGFVENASDADGYLKFSTSVNGTITEAMRINSDGNLVIAQSGKGIDFSANTGSSASGATVQSEVFDYYEEGTWTPTFYLGLSAQSWNQQYGHYIRIGQQVTVTFWLLGNGSGNTSDGNGMVIQGLPFTCGTSSGSHLYTRGHGVVNYIDLGSTVSAITLYGHNNQDRMGLGYNSGRTSFTAGSNGTAANGAYVIGGFTYFTGTF